jgi:hypothetical protein
MVHFRTDIGATNESASRDNGNYAKELETDVLIVGADAQASPAGF